MTPTRRGVSQKPGSGRALKFREPPADVRVFLDLLAEAVGKSIESDLVALEPEGAAQPAEKIRPPTP
jgi:hypothetical protein